MKPGATPWHRRVPVVGKGRDFLRARFFGALGNAFHTDDGRTIAADALRGALAWRPSMPAPAAVDTPYGDLGQPPGERSGRRAKAIIITARFRSGSTLLWNLFRQVPSCTAYYEPFNERRWFDPATRGDRVDQTHRGVADYWKEYAGLASLGAVYREDWIDRHLYMDESFWEPDMLEYVTRLIEAAPGRAVLQFNRIDFRLAWFRRMFPHATLVHLYRHPRDQWCSSLVDPKSVPRHITIDKFDPYDHFYLRAWARDLKYHFPFLDERIEPNPYRLFYYLWRLSYLLGVAHADLSMRFELLLAAPDDSIRQLMAVSGIDDYDLNALTAIVTPAPVGRWRDYADDTWFRSHEAACETVLRDFLVSSNHRYT